MHQKNEEDIILILSKSRKIIENHSDLRDLPLNQVFDILSGQQIDDVRVIWGAISYL